MVLDEWDKELEKRGQRFVRYGDDCNTYIRSQRAGERVMANLRRFITQRLKLKVNEAKSAVDVPSEAQVTRIYFHWRSVGESSQDRSGIATAVQASDTSADAAQLEH